MKIFKLFDIFLRWAQNPFNTKEERRFENAIKRGGAKKKEEVS